MNSRKTAPKAGGSEEPLETEAIRAQIVLQFGDPIFHVGPFCLPAQQLQAELSGRIGIIERQPLLHVLRLPFDP